MNNINTEKFAFYCLMAFTFGYIWNTFFPASPYMLFGEFVAGTFLAVGGKRLVQKTKTFQAGQVTCETERTVNGDGTEGGDGTK